MIEDSKTEFGVDEEVIARWKRVVRMLDFKVPGWRNNAPFMGDAAVQAISQLASHTKPAPEHTHSFYVVRDERATPAAPMLNELTKRYTLEVAKARAIELAQKHKHRFVVFGIDEIGSAGTSGPPVVWTEKS